MLKINLCVMFAGETNDIKHLSVSLIFPILSLQSHHRNVFDTYESGAEQHRKAFRMKFKYLMNAAMSHPEKHLCK